MGPLPGRHDAQLRARILEGYDRATSRLGTCRGCGLYVAPGMVCLRCKANAPTAVNRPRVKRGRDGLDPITRFLASVGSLFERTNPVRRLFQRKTA